MAMKARADVQAGICGHQTTIDAASDDGRAVSFTVETTCANIERFAARLAEAGAVDAYGEIDPRTESATLVMGRKARTCTDCVVPSAAVKALRVATGLALPADVAVGLAKLE